MSLPVGEPSVIPGDVYTATVKGEASAKPSTFDPNRLFYTLPLSLQSKGGETFEWTWAFGPKNRAYLKFLEIIGGQKSPSGKMIPPSEYQGRTFMIEIGKTVTKDDKPVNSVVDVWAVPAPGAEKDGIPF